MNNPADTLGPVETMGEIAARHAFQRGEKIAFRFEGRVTTYAEFDAHTSQIANALRGLGLKAGDRVAHLGKNTDLFFELMFGAGKAGVVLVPLNWRLSPAELVWIANDAEIKVLFVGPEFATTAAEMARNIAGDCVVINLEGGEEEFTRWRDSASAAAPAWKAVERDVVLQLYTSGTTGRPKGVMLAHRNLFGLRATAGAQLAVWNSWSESDVALVAMPVFHIGGAGFGATVIYNGATGVIAREFDVSRVLDFIGGENISKLFLVPAAMQIIVRDPRAHSVDFSRIKYMFYGASPIPIDLLRECIEVFRCGFVQMYGMTETAGTIVALPPEDHDPAGAPRMRAAGKPLPGVEIKIIDEAGKALPVGVVGEIATRSIANMAGYWNQAAATAAALSADGWLRTGDAGYVDEEGYVYIHDRVKDMIVSGGENVYPAEVENAIFGHPDVAEVCVIGVPDEKWGEAVKAIVVPKAGAVPDPNAIMAWARARIAGYKSPKSVEFVAALPRNASGKLLRREVRAPFWAGRDRQIN